MGDLVEGHAAALAAFLLEASSTTPSSTATQPPRPVPAPVDRLVARELRQPADEALVVGLALRAAGRGRARRPRGCRRPRSGPRRRGSPRPPRRPTAGRRGRCRRACRRRGAGACGRAGASTRRRPARSRGRSSLVRRSPALRRSPRASALPSPKKRVGRTHSGVNARVGTFSLPGIIAGAARLALKPPSRLDDAATRS